MVDGTSNSLCVVVSARLVTVAIDEEDPVKLRGIQVAAQKQIPRGSVDNPADGRRGDMEVQLGQEEGTDVALEQIVWKAVGTKEEPRCFFILAIPSGIWAHMVHIQLDESHDLRCAGKHWLCDVGCCRLERRAVGNA